MRRFFSASKTYIFVAPVAMAMSDDGGCSSSKVEPLTKEQFVAQVAGNTMKREDKHVVGFVERDGTLRAIVEIDGETKTDKGTWNFESDTQLCVAWELTLTPENNCAEMSVLEDGRYSWGGRTFVRIEGNPNNI